MSAFEKNKQALVALFGSDALAERLLTTRIGIRTSDSRTSAKLLGIVLADCLARLWPNIDFKGDLAEEQLRVAQAAAKSGSMSQAGLEIGWDDPHDVVLQIGDCGVQDESPYVLTVAADGWMAYLGPEGACSGDPNPVGPACAAALAAAQVFRHVFQAELADLEPQVLGRLAFDVRSICDMPELAVDDLNLEGTVFMGTGAVTHSLVWLLEKWPKQVSGRIDLVDPDPYGDSNGQRYAFMPPFTGNVMKVDSVRGRLGAAHPGLEIRPHAQDLNAYCQDRGYELPMLRAITGLDSPEARRHAALKLPRRAINLWTDEHRCGGSRYVPDGDAACLACDYLENTTDAMDEAAEFQLATGLQPQEVRHLLDSSAHLTKEQAATVASHRGISVDKIVDMPIRSIRPVLCASATVQVGQEKTAADVPFAFSSLMAGISGFVMLLADLRGASASAGWNQHVFKAPSRFMHSPRYKQAACACCNLVFSQSTVEGLAA